MKVSLKVIQGADEKPRHFPAYLTKVVTKEKFDCLACGACCAPPKDGSKKFQDGWTDVEPVDIAKLTRKELADSVIRRDEDEDGSYFFIRLVNHRTDGMRCFFLRGQIGKSAPCAIYERRPETCATFVMGSESCLDTREQAGMPVDRKKR